MRSQGQPAPALQRERLGQRNEHANLLGPRRPTAIMVPPLWSASVAVLPRLGTVLGTVRGSQLSSSTEIGIFPSVFDTVRWPRG